MAKTKKKKVKRKKAPKEKLDTPLEADARKVMEFILDYLAETAVIEGTRKKGTKRVTFIGMSFNSKTGEMRSHTEVIVEKIADFLQEHGFKPKEPSVLDERPRNPRPKRINALTRDHLIGEVKNLSDRILDSAYGYGLTKDQAVIAMEEAAVNWSPR